MIIELSDGSIRSTDGMWLPRISKKQFEILNDYHRYTMITGSRKTGKTLGVLHKVMRHLFDNDRACVAMVSCTLKAAKSQGVYTDLTTITMPEWINAGIGMHLTQEPKVLGDTRQSLFRVSNRHGTESECQLHSLDYAKDIEQKFKGTRFSMFYFIELDNFNDRIVFDIATDQLRSFTVDYNQLQFICDLNPPEEGPEFWAYDIWFREKDEENHSNPEFQKNIHRIDFGIDDNPFLSKEEKDELRAKYSKRKTLFNRFYLGKWEEDNEDTHFGEVFKPNIHILGDARAKEVCVPSDGCKELICGFDIGDVNHSAHIVEKITTQETDESTKLTEFVTIDELVSIDHPVTIRDFTEAFMEKINKWEAYCQTNYKRAVQWRCWSDSSALDRFRSVAKVRTIAEANDAFVVREVSGGKLLLMAAPKYNYSVRARVTLMQDLFSEDRLFISAQLFATLAMIRALRKGNKPTEYVRADKHKHPFDSLSYILHSEAPLDMLRNSQVKVAKAPSRLIFT